MVVVLAGVVLAGRRVRACIDDSLRDRAVFAGGEDLFVIGPHVRTVLAESYA